MKNKLEKHQCLKLAAWKISNHTVKDQFKVTFTDQISNSTLNPRNFLCFLYQAGLKRLKISNFNPAMSLKGHNQ